VPLPQVSIVFDGGAGGLSTTEDPQQETLGLLAHDAQVVISGAPRCGTRLFATGMAAGATAFSAPGAAACWRAGDRLVLSDLQVGRHHTLWWTGCGSEQLARSGGGIVSP
jgi:hypothetical protein